MTLNRVAVACTILITVSACAVVTVETSTTGTPAESSAARQLGRARDLGIPFDGQPGPWNAITDVAGVQVGHSTIIQGEGANAVRTGVTAIMADDPLRSVFASTYRLNGDGELTGTHYIQEKGYLISPILLTGTASVGTVHEATLRWSLQSERARHPVNLPVVGETWDGDLNDLYGLHVRPEHVYEALEGASSGPVTEGSVGGGTGMFSHGFKAGIGTASRQLSGRQGGYTVGVLVQANHGSRAELRIAGVPVGRGLATPMPELHSDSSGDGSILVIVATDAPLLPHQLQRVARRIPMGLARCGSYASTYSGDLFLAFSTQRIDRKRGGRTRGATLLDESSIDPVFLATVQATEEAIVNALVAAETMVGVRGNRVHAIPHEKLRDLLRDHDRLQE